MDFFRGFNSEEKHVPEVPISVNLTKVFLNPKFMKLWNEYHSVSLSC